MLKMGTKEGGRPDHQDSQTDTAIGSSSGTGSDQAYMEHFSDVPDHCVAVDSVQTADRGMKNDPDQVTSMAKMAPEKRSSFGSSIIRSASSSIKRKLKRLHRIDRSKSGVALALKGLKFISETEIRSGWEAVEKRFNQLAVHGSLSRADFGECIGMEKSKEFAGELFDALARKRKRLAKLVPNSSKKEELKKSNSSAKAELKELNSITKEELEVYWKQISDPSFESRLQTFLDMMDKDEDGRITKEELKQIISLSASANKLSKIQEHAEEYAQLIVEALDPDNLGYIRVENLEILLLEAPQLYEEEGKSNSRKLTKMLSQKLKPSKERNPIRRWYQKSKYLVQDNWPRIWIFGLWLGIVSGLFLYRFLQYRNKPVFHCMGYCVCIAKGAAETLKFNMAVMLLPVCRNTITWLRNNTKLGVAIPFDDNINFHMVIAVGIAVGVVLHGGAHMGCDFPRILHASEEEYEPMKPLLGEKQPTRYWWFVKGMEGWTGIVMVVLMAVAFTLAPSLFRRNKLKLPKLLQKLTGFNAFWYSHHLFVIVYALLIVHGIELYLIKEWYKKTTWMYLAFPVLLYACERLIRAFRSGIKPVEIQKASLYPGNVLALHMSKPQGFKYKSGQYMFVNCAAVSPFEWHPFSITSAPGDDYLSVHISKQGDWTGQLQTVFSKVCQAPTSAKSSYPKVLIDGPYGAPAQEYKEYEVVLLVGLGIGATPFISVVKDIINNRKAMEDEETELERGGRVGCLGLKENEVFKTRHAYFYWVTREQCSFEWFKDVINEVASLDERGAIELHNYCTSVYEEGDARSALIGMLQSLYHVKNGVDVVSGTNVKSHFGKPNWRKVYNRIALTHKDSRIGVFYCGQTGPIKTLRQLALDFSRDPKFETIFDFHKENF